VRGRSNGLSPVRERLACLLSRVALDEANHAGNPASSGERARSMGADGRVHFRPYGEARASPSDGARTTRTRLAGATDSAAERSGRMRNSEADPCGVNHRSRRGEYVE
jgi:hypothetical protein